MYLKNFGDGLDRITLFELLGERMVDQFLSGVLFISLQVAWKIDSSVELDGSLISQEELATTGGICPT